MNLIFLLVYTLSIKSCIAQISPVRLSKLNFRFTFGKMFSQILDICEDGLIDTAVRTIDGSTYIFKGPYFHTLNEHLNQTIDEGKLILLNWLPLPNSPQLSFTITNESSSIYGSTFFVKVSINFFNPNLFASAFAWILAWIQLK